MSKALIIYYSWSQAGNTKHLAEIIQKQTGADIFRIKTVKPYPGTYAACVAKAGMEIMKGTLPDLQELPDISGYDTIFLGTCIWWGNMSLPMKTLVNKVDFNGKRLLPFCTHGGGGAGKYFAKTAEICKGATVCPGIAFLKGGSPDTEQKIADWLEKNK